MITYLYRSVREDALSPIDKFRNGTWIHVEDPSDIELELLAEKYNLDPDLLMDALDPDEIPRIEAEDENVYVYTRYAIRNGSHVATSPVLLVVGPKFVATIGRQPLPDLKRLQATPDMYTTQRPKLLLQIMRHLIGSYETNVTFLTRQIRGVRTRLSVATINNRDFVQFVVIEDALNSFLSELVPTNLLLTTLLAGRYKLSFFEDDKDLIEDLIQSTRQLGESSRSAQRTIVNIREAYSNIMTNNLNRQIKLLTSLTVVLTLPTIVFSLFGMNVPVPGSNNHLSFAVIGIGTIVACVVALYVLYRKRWF
jgi:magnesium transporter